MTFKLTIEESNIRHILEREKRYDVKVNGVVVDELYYNVMGYRGALMTVLGNRFDLGEKGISTWKKLAAELNREARAVSESVASDPMKIASATLTIDGDTMNVVFFDKVRNRDFDGSVPTKLYRAGVELFGETLSAAYFGENIGAPLQTLAERIQDAVEMAAVDWNRERVCFALLETAAPETMAAMIGSSILTDELRTGTIDDVDRRGIGIDVDQIVFLRRETASTIAGVCGGDVVLADALPGRGYTSELTRIFSKPLTSTGDRPVIVTPDDTFTDAIKRQGYRSVAADVSATPEM